MDIKFLLPLHKNVIFVTHNDGFFFTFTISKFQIRLRFTIIG